MLTEQEVKKDWFKTIENQIISSETKKMIDSVRLSLGRELTLTDEEIATIYVLVIKSFNNELENRNESFTEQKMMTTFSNFMFIYQTEGYDGFFDKFKDTISALRIYGLDKELKKILAYNEDINFVSRFYEKDNEQHYLIVDNLSHQFHDIVEKKGFFKSGYKIVNTLMMKDFVQYINLQQDSYRLTTKRMKNVKSKSIQEFIKNNSDIPIGAVVRMGLTVDDLGLKFFDNYFAQNMLHTTDYHLYREARLKEMEDFFYKERQVKDLTYPWRKDSTKTVSKEEIEDFIEWGRGFLEKNKL